MDSQISQPGDGHRSMAIRIKGGMQKVPLLIIAIVPGIILCVIFELCLGHRHDYSGHLAAGYGATFAAAMFFLRILNAAEIKQRLTRYVFPFCIACIAGGALAEATAFRIAKFDEIDFFNQSIGAVLATICASAYIGIDETPDSQYDHGLIAGIVFLGVGGCLAVA